MLRPRAEAWHKALRMNQLLYRTSHKKNVFLFPALYERGVCT